MPQGLNSRLLLPTSKAEFKKLVSASFTDSQLFLYPSFGAKGMFPLFWSSARSPPPFLKSVLCVWSKGRVLSVNLWRQRDWKLSFVLFEAKPLPSVVIRIISDQDLRMCLNFHSLASYSQITLKNISLITTKMPFLLIGNNSCGKNYNYTNIHAWTLGMCQGNKWSHLILRTAPWCR